jgi:hypothetical protein
MAKKKLVTHPNGMTSQYAPSPKSIGRWLVTKGLIRDARKSIVSEDKALEYAAKAIQAHSTGSITGVDFPVIMDTSGTVRAVTTTPLPNSSPVQGWQLGVAKVRFCDVHTYTVKAKTVIRKFADIGPSSVAYLQKILSTPAAAPTSRVTGYQRRVNKGIGRTPPNPAKHRRVMRSLRKSKAK